MLIAKVQISPNRERFAEVARVGEVLFDPRPGWVLLRWPIGARPRQTEWEWLHPDDTNFVWVREFNF